MLRKREIMFAFFSMIDYSSATQINFFSVFCTTPHPSAVFCALLLCRTIDSTDLILKFSSATRNNILLFLCQPPPPLLVGGGWLCFYFFLLFSIKLTYNFLKMLRICEIICFSFAPPSANPTPFCDGGGWGVAIFIGCIFFRSIFSH